MNATESDRLSNEPSPSSREAAGLFRRPFRIIRENMRVYLALNAVMYGLALVGFMLALVFPELNAARATALQEDGTADLVISLLGNPWLFALTILGVNTLTVGVASILLPSMVIPFAGIAIFAYRAFIIGLSLALDDRAMWIALIPHSLTFVIEFQAYVLLTLGAYLIGRSWLWPETAGVQLRRHGYLHGLRQAGSLSIPALALLIIGAVYEAFSLVYLIPILV